VWVTFKRQCTKFRQEEEEQHRAKWLQKLRRETNFLSSSVSHKTSAVLLLMSDAYYLHTDSTADLLFTSSLSRLLVFVSGCVVVSDHFLVHFSPSVMQGQSADDGHEDNGVGKRLIL
jgi:hypothetical protein